MTPTSPTRTARARARQSWLMLGAIALMAAVAISPNARAQTTVEPPELLDGQALVSLVSPLALYPDDLVAIMLPAATYPLQVVEAARFLQDQQSDPTLEPDTDWDDAIIALLNYPEALQLLNEDLDWTWQLGEAVVNQQPDVIEAIEIFRDQAYLAGNLRTDERQLVTREDGALQIAPADPEVIYVPYYNPVTVIHRQPRRAYFYYGNPCPVYYRPYAADFFFGRPRFWGVSTAFGISWGNRFLHLRFFDHVGHPFYGRFRSFDPFYRVRYSRDYRVFSGNRRFTHRGNNFHWYPTRVRGGSPRFNRYRGDGRRTLRYANDRTARVRNTGGQVRRNYVTNSSRAQRERARYRTFDNVVEPRANNRNARVTSRTRDGVNRNSRANTTNRTRADSNDRNTNRGSVIKRDNRQTRQVPIKQRTLNNRRNTEARQEREARTVITSRTTTRTRTNRPANSTAAQQRAARSDRQRSVRTTQPRQQQRATPQRQTRERARTTQPRQSRPRERAAPQRQSRPRERAAPQRQSRPRSRAPAQRQSRSSNRSSQRSSRSNQRSSGRRER